MFQWYEALSMFAVIAAAFGLAHLFLQRMRKNSAAVLAENAKAEERQKLFEEIFGEPFIEANAKNLEARGELEYKVDYTIHTLARTLFDLFKKQKENLDKGFTIDHLLHVVEGPLLAEMGSKQSLEEWKKKKTPPFAPEIVAEQECLKVQIGVMKKQLRRAFEVARDLGFRVRWISGSGQVLLCTKEEILAHNAGNLIEEFQHEIRAYVPEIDESIFTRSFNFPNLPAKDGRGQKKEKAETAPVA